MYSSLNKTYKFQNKLTNAILISCNGAFYKDLSYSHKAIRSYFSSSNSTLTLLFLFFYLSGLFGNGVFALMFAMSFTLDLDGSSRSTSTTFNAPILTLSMSDSIIFEDAPLALHNSIIHNECILLLHNVVQILISLQSNSINFLIFAPYNLMSFCILS